jgi:TonB family protein
VTEPVSQAKVNQGRTRMDQIGPEMARMWARFLVGSFALTCSVSQGQTAIPDRLPELKYPPIARAARVQGDVIVSFRQTPDGNTVDVTPISGPAMLQGVAVENVKTWHFAPPAEPAGQVYKAVFHFQLNPPEDGFDDNQPTTKVELDGAGGVRVLSILTTGLQRMECPSAVERELPPAVISGDFVELDRWNEIVRVGADGSVSWNFRKALRRGRITPAEAKSLLEQFRTRPVWNLCGNYNQAGLMDGGGSSFKVRIGGREKGVSEYGDVAPSIFREVELSVDAAANTHQWRHGDPSTESIVEISYEYLPKPGKTKLMDAALRGDKVGFKAALAAGDKLTDVDASGWTPLMYAAGSFGDSLEGELLKAGAKVNARSKRGETALMASAVAGMVDEDLLDAGAEVNAVDDVGMTALMLLVQRGNPDEIEALLRAGADARKKDALGRTALDYLNAANCGRPIVQAKDPQWMTVGYSRCNALNDDDYQKSKRLLMGSGARRTHALAPKGPQI